MKDLKIREDWDQEDLNIVAEEDPHMSTEVVLEEAIEVEDASPHIEEITEVTIEEIEDMETEDTDVVVAHTEEAQLEDSLAHHQEDTAEALQGDITTECHQEDIAEALHQETKKMKLIEEKN